MHGLLLSHYACEQGEMPLVSDDLERSLDVFRRVILYADFDTYIDFMSWVQLV